MRRLALLVALACLALASTLESPPPDPYRKHSPSETGPGASGLEGTRPTVEPRIRRHPRRARHARTTEPTESEPAAGARGRSWIVCGRVFDPYGDPLRSGTATVRVRRSFCGHARTGFVEVAGTIRDGRYEIDVSEAMSPIALPTSIEFEAAGTLQETVQLSLAALDLMREGEARLDDVRLRIEPSAR